MCTHELISNTLRCWKFLLIDSSIVSVLRECRDDELCNAPGLSSPAVNAQVQLPGRTLVRRVHHRVSHEFGIYQISDEEINNRIEVLEDSDAVIARGSTMQTFHLRMWRRPARTGGDSDDIILDKPEDSLIRGKIYCLGDRVSADVSAFRWLHCAIMDFYSCLVVGPDILLGSPTKSSDLVYREHCERLAHSLNMSTAMKCAKLFHNIVVLCSHNPLTERGLADIISPDPDPKKYELTLDCDPDDNECSSLTTKSVSSDSIDSTEQMISRIWDHPFLVSRERIRVMHEDSLSMPFIPPSIGKWLLLECSKQNFPSEKPQKKKRSESFSEFCRDRDLEGLYRGDSDDVELRLRAFYEIFSPDKIKSVPDLCQKYKYQKHKLVHLLHLKYHNELDAIWDDMSRYSTVTFADFFSSILCAVDDCSAGHNLIVSANYFSGEGLFTKELYLENIVHDYIRIVITQLEKWTEFTVESDITEEVNVDYSTGVFVNYPVKGLQQLL